MTDQGVHTNLAEAVLHDNNQDKIVVRSWTNFITIPVFLSQIFLILLTNFGFLWKVHQAKSCDESTIWMSILLNAAG